MIRNCSVCWKEYFETRKINPRAISTRAYCSKRCALKGQTSPNRFFGIFITLFSFAYVIVMIEFQNNYIIPRDKLLYSLLPGFAMTLLGLINLYNWSKGRKYNREDEGISIQEIQAKSLKGKHKPVK